MEADWAVELGAGDETLEMPWAAAEGGPRYHDLKRQPELLRNIEEAGRIPELAQCLAAINSPVSILETAKCDAWASSEPGSPTSAFARWGGEARPHSKSTRNAIIIRSC